ncbi:MAG: DCC1-like thiol-disulfide oxidoreductase family protein [Pseudomonadota bacterium]
MAHLHHFTRYAWRSDPMVPEFRDQGTVAFMDGECVLCMAGARLIDRIDSAGTVGICPTQTVLGKAMLTHFGMSPEDPDSWLVIRDGRAYTALEAIIVLGRSVGGVASLVRVLCLLPRPVRDWLYHRIARNRFALMGRRSTCELPTPSLQARLVEPV